ncbi:uncharacterized protein [Temnothorax longispinosus]|uniref:uncharacterized protein n=1 Tax=Temnothorax longispinosus TaxID=300112 RepID=UPI003A999720
MAADCVADGDYLGEYSRFFAEFVARVNPDDQLPVKVSVCDVNESELVGEIISLTLQYLNRIYCPPSLQSYIARLVIQAIKSTCKKQPEICGLRQQEKTYAPLKLMQAVTNEVNEICRRYLDNSRLALLPPPSSTPQVTVGAIKNSRRKMEDRHMILHDLNTMFNIQDDTIVDYYAVFDGHGGQDAAAYCATHLHQYLVESVHYPTDPERALRDAFLTTDAQFIAKSSTQKLNGGTTVVCALLINKKLYIAWVGDSMASLVTRGNVKQLVNPHRPMREDETERIHNMGGAVVHCMGVLRVNGLLSISRAIGDVPYKPYISGEPEVRCVHLDGTEDFLIIACDGLWDYVDQRTAALRVYRQVLQNPYDLKHVHQALLQSAKRAGSLDNITVIVVFLTPPIEIASRSNPFLTHQAPNGLLLNNMDSNNPIPSNRDQFEVNPSAFIKQLLEDADRPSYDMDLLTSNTGCGRMARNGKHRDDDDEYDYTDNLGPETDVDAGEDVHDNNYPLAASLSLDPSPESEKSPVEAEKHSSDDDRNDNNYSNRDNANVCPVDSIVDDGNVDNRVRPSDRDVRDADDEMLRDHDDDDDARIETAGMHTVVDDDKSQPSPRAAKPPQHAQFEPDNVVDTDSEDEWNYYRPNEQESAAVAVAPDESRKGVEEQSTQENPESVAKGSSEVEPPETENDIKCEELVKDTSSSELINTNISDEKKSSELEKDQILLDLQKEKTEQDNMDFQLNPEAAEFVPSSPPLMGPRVFLEDFAISGSPLKQPQAMDDISIPSQSEFDKEVCYRPKEIGEEFSHDEQADLQNNGLQSMDVSEISSTKAEMGDDESMMHVTSTSQWQTNISSQWNEKTGDDAGSDLEEDDIVTKNNPMAMSLTPGNFKAAFEKSVDLNAVHILDDSSDGAEQVNTPPRSPKPYADEDRAHTPLSEDKSPSDILCASTPQPTDDNSVSTMSSEISSETKTSSLSTTVRYKEKLNREPIIITTKPPFSSLGIKVMECLPVELEGFHYFSAEMKHDGSIRSESSIEECEEDAKLTKDEEDAKLTKDEEDAKLTKDKEDAKLTKEEKEEKIKQLFSLSDDADTARIMKQAAQSLQNSSQIIEKESMESEVPKNLPDSTNHLNLNDAIHISKQDVVPQSLLSEKIFPETASGTEQTHYHANLDSAIISEKMDTFSQSFKTESSQLNQSNRTDCYKSENSMPQLENVDPEFAHEDGSQLENRKQKEVENLLFLCDNGKPDFATEFINPFSFGSMQKFSFAEDKLQQKNKMFMEHVPTEPTTLINKPTEQEQAKLIPAELLIDVDKVLNINVESENIPSKEGETEPRETAKASPENTAAIDKSKEEVTGIAGASVGAVVAATAAAVATVSPIKAKAATTTSAKRPTKTTTKATTASTTKTITKSTPTSPSKTVSAAMRATTSPAQSAAKKPATSTATRPKQLDGSTKAAISSTSGKTTVTKTTITTKAATTTTATRTSASPRLSSGTTRPKTTTTISSKVNSGISSEKKSTMSSDAKSVSKPATTKPTSATLRTTITSTTAKTTLAKTSSTTAKTSASSVTLKPRPASATAAAKITSISKQPATGVNSASRPRTAPTTSTIKPRENTGRTITATTTKSPLIDKQSKETVNKQISRSGASAPKISGRTSAPTGTTGVTKTRTLTGKSTGNATSPTKKTLTSKTASRTSSTATKRLSSSETKVLQNGIPKEDVTKAAVITATSKPEDDVPRKDTSPVNVPTDNQLIAD